MTARTSYPGNAVVGEVLTATNVNKAAAGWLGYTAVTSQQTGISSEADLTGVTETITAPSNRRLKVSFHGLMQSDTANNMSRIRIKRDGTTIAESSQVHGTAGGPGQLTHDFSAIDTPSSGSRVYKATAQRQTGSGTVISAATSVDGTYILIEDMGPAS